MSLIHAEPIAMPALTITDEMFIDDITIGDRYRKDIGDIAPLAESIRTIGLLHPIVVATDNRLVAGERRLTAMRQLGWTKAPVRRISIDAIVIGEHDENEVRKDFTASERVAIAQAVAEGLGNRQGQRTDLGLPDNCPGVGETRDIAAQRSGFGSGKQFERAKYVVTSGVPELVEAMDSGKVSISAAHAISRQDHDTQRRLAAEDNIKVRSAELRRAEADLAAVKAIPKPAPKTEEEKARQVRVFGTQSDRLVWSRINDVVQTISAQPSPAEAVKSIPPSLHHAVNIPEIESTINWLSQFVTNWKESQNAD